MLINPNVGWLLWKSVSSCIQPVLGWAVGWTGLDVTHTTRCYAKNDVTLMTKLRPDPALWESKLFGS